jgi:Domain of unknown function (DUF4440)
MTDSAPAPDLPSDRAALVAANAALNRALVEQDIDTLDALLSPLFTAVHITGQQQSKTDWLTQIRSGRMAYDHVAEESIDITVDGDTATLITRNRVTASIWGARGTWPLESTTTYARSGTGWVIRRSTAATY